MQNQFQYSVSEGGGQWVLCKNNKGMAGNGEKWYEIRDLKIFRDIRRNIVSQITVVKLKILKKIT